MAYTIQRIRRASIIVYAGMLFTISCDNPVSRNTDFYAEAPFEFCLDASAYSRISLEGINGDIIISGMANSTQCLITGYRRIESSSESDAEANLEYLDVEVQQSSGNIYVKTQQPSDTKHRNLLVNYHVQIPSEFAVIVDNVTGFVSIDSIDGAVAVNLVTGMVRLADIHGNVSVNVVTGVIDGRISLQDNGYIDMTVVTGRNILAIPKGSSAQLAANVSTGTITVTDLSLIQQNSSPGMLTGYLGDGEESISLRTVRGDIVISGF